MHKGDERTRTMEIYVDGDLQTSWTSSGTTTAFENIEVDANGQAVEIRGVLTDSEWLSITEVRASWAVKHVRVGQRLTQKLRHRLRLQRKCFAAHKRDDRAKNLDVFVPEHIYASSSARRLMMIYTNNMVNVRPQLVLHSAIPPPWFSASLSRSFFLSSAGGDSCRRRWWR